MQRRRVAGEGVQRRHVDKRRLTPDRSVSRGNEQSDEGGGQCEPRLRRRRRARQPESGGPVVVPEADQTGDQRQCLGAVRERPDPQLFGVTRSQRKGHHEAAQRQQDRKERRLRPADREVVAQAELRQRKQRRGHVHQHGRQRVDAFPDHVVAEQQGGDHGQQRVRVEPSGDAEVVAALHIVDRQRRQTDNTHADGPLRKRGGKALPPRHPQPPNQQQGHRGDGAQPPPVVGEKRELQRFRRLHTERLHQRRGEHKRQDAARRRRVQPPGLVVPPRRHGVQPALERQRHHRSHSHVQLAAGSNPQPDGKESAGEGDDVSPVEEGKGEGGFQICDFRFAICDPGFGIPDFGLRGARFGLRACRFRRRTSVGQPPRHS